MAETKNHEFAMIALVAIVAVVGLVMVFMNQATVIQQPVAAAPVISTDTTTAGNMGGQAMKATTNIKQTGIEVNEIDWDCTGTDWNSGTCPCTASMCNEGMSAQGCKLVSMNCNEGTTE